MRYELAKETPQPPYCDANGMRRIAELEMVCAELYQVIGSLSSYAGLFEHPDVQRALDNASQAKLVHADLLPWPRDDELAREICERDAA